MLLGQLRHAILFFLIFNQKTPKIVVPIFERDSCAIILNRHSRHSKHSKHSTHSIGIVWYRRHFIGIVWYRRHIIGIVWNRLVGIVWNSRHSIME